jgi:Ca-activated chloride channel family protein
MKDEQGHFAGYKKNKKGEVVMSKLDEALLTKIASDTGGAYFHAENGSVDLTRLIDDLQTLDKKKLTSRLNRQMEDRYQYLLFIGLILLFIECAITGTKKRNHERLLS